MKELEANRLYLRQKRHPTEEETGAEYDAKKDQGPFVFSVFALSHSLTGISMKTDATDGAELSLTLTGEVGPHGEMVRFHMQSVT